MPCMGRPASPPSPVSQPAFKLKRFRVQFKSFCCSFFFSVADFFAPTKSFIDIDFQIFYINLGGFKFSRHYSSFAFYNIRISMTLNFVGIIPPHTPWIDKSVFSVNAQNYFLADTFIRILSRIFFFSWWILFFQLGIVSAKSSDVQRFLQPLHLLATAFCQLLTFFVLLTLCQLLTLCHLDLTLGILVFYFVLLAQTPVEKVCLICPVWTFVM